MRKTEKRFQKIHVIVIDFNETRKISDARASRFHRDSRRDICCVAENKYLQKYAIRAKQKNAENVTIYISGILHGKRGGRFVYSAIACFSAIHVAVSKDRLASHNQL